MSRTVKPALSVIKEVETERLQLRLFKPDDLDELAVIFGDPEVVRHLGSGKPAPREETETALRSIIRHWEIYGFGRWAAIHKPTQRLIGYCGLRNYHGTPELVYLLARQHWGMGLATEMARAALRYGFEERGFERIIAMAKIENVASQHVMRKIGMSFQERAMIFNMEVTFYSISRETFFSESGINRLTIIRPLETAEPHLTFKFGDNNPPLSTSSPELEAELVSR